MIYSSLNLVIDGVIVGLLRSVSPVSPGYTKTEYKYALEGILYDLEGSEVVEFDYFEMFLSKIDEQHRITFQDFCRLLTLSMELDLSSMYGDLLKQPCYILHQTYEDTKLTEARYYSVIR